MMHSHGYSCEPGCQGLNLALFLPQCHHGVISCNVVVRIQVPSCRRLRGLWAGVATITRSPSHSVHYDHALAPSHCSPASFPSCVPEQFQFLFEGTSSTKLYLILQASPFSHQYSMLISSLRHTSLPTSRSPHQSRGTLAGYFSFHSAVTTSRMNVYLPC